MTRGRARLATASLVVLLGATACATPQTAAPTCAGDQRTATLAQAVPTAAYVPCIAELPAGWTVEQFQVRRGSATFTLESDREDHPVDVRFTDRCDVTGAVAIAPRDDGVRTYLLVRTIAPRFGGRFADVFPGGCVTYEFEFDRGPHIALTDDLRAAIDLYPRRELRLELEEKFGVTLDP